MPFTMAAFTLAAVSMIGLPPMGGFISKWYLIIGAIEAGQTPIIIVLVVSTILNAGYFLPIIYAAFFKEPNPEIQNPKSKIREAPVLMVVSLMLTAIGALLLFFMPSVFLELAKMIAASVTGSN